MAILRGFRHLPRTLSEWGSWFKKSQIESALGNPAAATQVQVLSSDADGARSWVDRDAGVQAPDTFRVPNWTTAQLASITYAVNTTNKRAGTQVYNTDTGLPLWSAGNAASDVWKTAAGATAHTPA